MRRATPITSRSRDSSATIRSMRRRLERPRVAPNQTLLDLLPIPAFISGDERLQAVFDNALDAILLVNDQARFIDVNRAACALFGHTRDRLLTLTVWDITPP